MNYQQLYQISFLNNLFYRALHLLRKANSNYYNHIMTEIEENKALIAIPSQESAKPRTEQTQQENQYVTDQIRSKKTQIQTLKKEIQQLHVKLQSSQLKLQQQQKNYQEALSLIETQKQKIQTLKENNDSIMHTFQVFQREFVKRDYKNGINIQPDKQKSTSTEGPFFLELIRNMKSKLTDLPEEKNHTNSNAFLNQNYGFFFNQQIEDKEAQFFNHIMQKKQLTQSHVNKLKNYGRKNYFNQKYRQWVWFNIVDKPLKISQKFYNILVQRCEANHQAQNLNNINGQIKYSLIDRDLNRMDFRLDDQKSKLMKNSIRKCLQAFQLYRPDIGYVQGMSYLAWMILIRMGDLQGFSIFSNLILCDPFVYTLYFFKEEGLKKIKSFVEKCIQDKKSKLYKHLKNLQVQFELFIIQWAYTMFTRAFSLRISSKIWDLWLSEDYNVFFRVVLVIFEMLQDEILQLNQNDKIIELIKSQTPKLDQVQFLKLLKKQKLPEQLQLIVNV